MSFRCVASVITSILLCFQAFSAGNSILLPVYFHSTDAKSQGSYTACTAQYFRAGKDCHLISANHCARSPYNKAVLKVNQIDIEVKILKRFPDIETVSLQLPEEFKKFCAEMPDLAKQFYRKPQFGDRETPSLRSDGFISGKLHTQYTQGADWSSRMYGYAAVEFLNTGKNDWYFAHGIQAFPGMSGGSVTTLGGEAFGMQVRAIPFQDNSIIVPYPLIISHLQGIRQKSASTEAISKEIAKERMKLVSKTNEMVDSSRLSSSIFTSDNIFAGTGDNAGKGTGDNAGKGTGDNAGKGTGGNSPKSTEETIALKQDIENVLELLQEPNEGIVDPQDPNKILLGIGNFQIDGQDDYYKYSPYLSIAPKITRPRQTLSYPDEDIRKDILRRFEGYYKPILHMEGSRHLLYVEDATSPTGWNLIGHSNTLFGIDFNSKKKRMTFEIGIHFLIARGNINFGNVPLQKNTEFEIFLDKGAQTITLREDNTTLWDCPNQHYLKIICRPRDKADKQILSLSKNQNGRGLINIRFAQFSEINGKKAFEYYYGKIDQSDDASKWRR